MNVLGYKTLDGVSRDTKIEVLALLKLLINKVLRETAEVPWWLVPW
jgi:hypothetical protein